MSLPFSKILVANRGEIACRIIRTARRLGIATVAVYSDADARALHVEMADEAYRIGPAPPLESYLRGENILEAARRSGAEAVHPGYGFLAENPDFAEACADAGIAFIGPPAEAVRAMGSKSAARELLSAAGVPLVPGYHGPDQGEGRLAREAEAIGYPVLIKASSGGGGKGMRVAESPGELAEALASARREAAKAFGDERMLLEKYLERSRHVEFQVFADTLGNTIHLFERDCSAQRRYQKIVEEAPAPGVGPELRSRMGAAAVAAARAVGYVGAGTVEFLLERDGSFHFMEMNTRLQVEHPVTELITGQDLVEWQIRIAAGEPLPLGQEELTLSGHAIEARIYAEDPDRDFLPSAGRLDLLRLPETGEDLRIDTGVRQGDAVGIDYDPMIAKLIVRAEDRAGAVARLQRALGSCRVAGVKTNLPFLCGFVSNPAFSRGSLDTTFIETHRKELGPAPEGTQVKMLPLAALCVLLLRAAEARDRARSSEDPHSPWHRGDGWRLNEDPQILLRLRDEMTPFDIVARPKKRGWLLILPEGKISAEGEIVGDGEMVARFGGERIEASFLHREGHLTVLAKGRSSTYSLGDPIEEDGPEEAGRGSLSAPMPGRIVAVLVEPGQSVRPGDRLMILEAMKMETPVTAPFAGKVEVIRFGVDASVDGGEELLTLKPHKED